MSEHTFKLGDTVKVAPFSSIGTIVDIDNRFARVQLAGSVVRVKITQLVLQKAAGTVSQSGYEGAGTRPRGIKLESSALDSDPRKLLTLDLHGATTAVAVELLEQQVSRAVMVGLHEIEIIHGIGSGRVKSAVHARLSSLNAVAHFELKLSNHGVTRVFLRG